MNQAIYNRGLKLGIEAAALFMITEWNKELIDKYKDKQKEFKDFIKKHKELK